MLKGKKGVVVGVANRRSIAWAIARRAAESGASLVLNYQGERQKDDVTALVAQLGEGTPALPCDVGSDQAVKDFLDQAAAHLGGLDFLVHSVAFANRDELEGRFLNTSREGYALAQDVSAYSLVTLARAAQPHMASGSAILALSYIGSERVVPHYNVMGVAKAALEACVRYLAADLGPQGVRVNAVSAGPVNTVSARGISGFSRILDHVARTSPLRCNVTADEVADAALFLLSPYARAVTGEVLHADAGYHCMGMPMPEVEPEVEGE